MATIEIPDYVLKDLLLTPDDLKAELALSLYERQRLSVSEAAYLVGVTEAQFYTLLAERNILSNNFSSATDNQSTTSLPDLIDRLRKIDAIAFDFLVEIAYEMRTPANAFLGISELLLKDPNASLTDFQKEWLSALKEEAQNLIRHIDEVYDQVKLRAGWFKLNIDQVDLPQLLNQVSSVISDYLANALKRAARDRNSRIKPKIEYNIPAELPLYIRADGLRIQRILIEILLKALKMDRTCESRVTFAVDCDDHQIKMKIVEEGLGLPEHLQGQTPRLPLTAKSIVKMHQGQLDIVLQESGGWTMTLILPLDQEKINITNIEIPERDNLSQPLSSQEPFLILLLSVFNRLQL